MAHEQQANRADDPQSKRNSARSGNSQTTPSAGPAPRKPDRSGNAARGIRFVGLQASADRLSQAAGRSAPSIWRANNFPLVSRRPGTVPKRRLPGQLSDRAGTAAAYFADHWL